MEGDKDGCVVGDGAVYVSAARRMKGVVKPQQSATSKKDVIYANGLGVEASAIVVKLVCQLRNNVFHCQSKSLSSFNFELTDGAVDARRFLTSMKSMN